MNQKLRSAKNIVPKPQNPFYPSKTKKAQVEQPEPNNEASKLRAALVQAIDENEIMRGRIIELQAMLAAFQQEMEEREALFARDLSRLYEQGLAGEGKKEAEGKGRVIERRHSCSF